MDVRLHHFHLDENQGLDESRDFLLRERGITAKSYLALTFWPSRFLRNTKNNSNMT
jgi:hypothetical protein